MAGLKVKFLVPVTFGFEPTTPGYEPKTIGKEVKFESRTFEVDEEFEFPAEERDAVKALIEDGLAVKAGSEGNDKAKAVQKATDDHTAAGDNPALDPQAGAGKGTDHTGQGGLNNPDPDPKAKPVK